MVPNIGEQNQRWLPQPCILVGTKEGGNAMSPLHSWGSPTPSAGMKIRKGPKRGRKCYLRCPQRQALGAKLDVVPNKGVHKQKWLPHPCFLRSHPKSANATSPVHSRGSPMSSAGRKIRNVPQKTRNKIGSGCLTPAFLGAQKRAEMLPQPCLVGSAQPQARGGKSEMVPNIVEKNRSGYLNPTFPGAQKRAEMLPHPCLVGSAQPQARGGKSEMVPNIVEKNRSGYLTPTFPGAQKRAEMLPHPRILGGPQREARGGKSEAVPNKGVNK